MHNWSPSGRPSEAPAAVSLTASLVTTTTLLAAFGGMALGIDGWWIAFPVGFGAVMPLAMGVAKTWADRAGSGDTAGGRTRASSDVGSTDENDALATLRERYARDEIDEAEFERRVETLLGSEERERTSSRSIQVEDSTDRVRER